MSFLNQLNPQQREAVETTDGPVLILAGAGSGKTRVITYRIAYLIENRGAMADSILAMTFTNKAAQEMVERVDKLVGGLSVAKPVISTFHSFCVRLLRRDIEQLRIPSSVPGVPPLGLTKSFVIYDESDQQQLVKSVMRRLGIDDKQTTPRSVLSHISWAKNHILDPQEVYLQSGDPKIERVAHTHHCNDITDRPPQPDRAIAAGVLAEMGQRRRLDQRQSRAQEKPECQDHCTDPQKGRGSEYAEPAQRPCQRSHSQQASLLVGRIGKPPPQMRRNDAGNLGQRHHRPDFDRREADRVEIDAEERRECADVCEIEEVEAGELPAR